MIKINNLVLAYDEKEVVSNVSLSFARGDFTAICGPNGAGKSSLIKSIIGSLKKKSGEIIIDQKNQEMISQRELAKFIAYVPQSFQMQFDYTAFEVALMGRFPYLDKWQNYSKKDKELTQEALAKMGLSASANQKYACLSGGEQQRVFIARAINQTSDAILMDEAFSHLDLHHQYEMINYLSEMQKSENKLIIMVSHQLNLASEYCNKIYMLAAGKIICAGTPSEVINQANIQKIYGAGIYVYNNPISGQAHVSICKKS